MARFKFLHNQDSPTIDNATFDSTSNDVSLVVGKKLVMLFTDFVKDKYFHHKSDTSVDVTEFKYYFLSCSGEFPFTPANSTVYEFTNDGDYDYCNDITSFDLGKCLKVKINGVERYIATMNASGNCTLTLKKTNSSGDTLDSVNVNGVPQDISGNTITLNGTTLSSDDLIIVSSYGGGSGDTPLQPNYTHSIACIDGSLLQASATTTNVSVTVKADSEHTSMDGYTIKTYSGSTLLGTTQLSGTSPQTVSANITANTSTSSRTIIAKLYDTNNEEVGSSQISQSGATPNYSYSLAKVSPTGNTIVKAGETVSLKVNATDGNGDVVANPITQYSGLTIQTMLGGSVVDTYNVTSTGTYTYAVPSFDVLVDYRNVTFTLLQNGTQLSQVTYKQFGRTPIVSVASKTHSTILVNLSDSDITSMQRVLQIKKNNSSFCNITIPDGTSQFTITNSVLSSISDSTLQQLEPSTTYSLSYSIKMSNDPSVGVCHSTTINVTTDAAPTYAISTPNTTIAYTATSISMTAKINGSQPCAGYYVTLNDGQAVQLDSNGAHQFTIPQNTSTTQITYTIKLYPTNDTTATPLATKSVTQSAAPAPATPYYWVTRSGILSQDNAISRCTSDKEVTVNTVITDCANNIYFFVPASKNSTLWVVNAAFESDVFIKTSTNTLSSIVDAPVDVTVNGIAYKMYHFSTNGANYTFKIKS